MTSYVKTFSFDLALGTATTALACYGINQFNPSPNPELLVLIGVVHTCVRITIDRLLQTIHGLPSKDRIEASSKMRWGILGTLLHFSCGVTLPFFYKNLGDRVGYQMPSYLTLYGFVILAGAPFWASRTIITSIHSYVFPPEKKRG